MTTDIVEGIKRLTRERDRFERRLQRAVRIIKDQEGLISALRSEMNRLHTERDDLRTSLMAYGAKREEGT